MPFDFTVLAIIIVIAARYEHAKALELVDGGFTGLVGMENELVVGVQAKDDDPMRSTDAKDLT